jgi:hypothetical protein
MCQDSPSLFCKRSYRGIKKGVTLASVFTCILSSSKLLVTTTSEGSWCDIGKALSRQKKESFIKLCYINCQKLCSFGNRWVNRYGELVKCHWQRKTKLLGEKPVRLPLSSPQIPHELKPVTKFGHPRHRTRQKTNYQSYGKSKGNGKVTSVQILKVTVSWRSQISRQSPHAGVKVVNPTHRPPLPPRKYFWHSFILEAESTPVT